MSGLDDAYHLLDESVRKSHHALSLLPHQDARLGQKIYQVDWHVMVAVTGVLADALALVRHTQSWLLCVRLVAHAPCRRKRLTPPGLNTVRRCVWRGRTRRTTARRTASPSRCDTWSSASVTSSTSAPWSVAQPNESMPTNQDEVGTYQLPPHL